MPASPGRKEPAAARPGIIPPPEEPEPGFVALAPGDAPEDAPSGNPSASKFVGG